MAKKCLLWDFPMGCRTRGRLIVNHFVTWRADSLWLIWQKDKLRAGNFLRAPSNQSQANNVDLGRLAPWRAFIADSVTLFINRGLRRLERKIGNVTKRRRQFAGDPDREKLSCSLHVPKSKHIKKISPLRAPYVMYPQQIDVFNRRSIDGLSGRKSDVY